MRNIPKKLLQTAVIIGGFVPVLAGFSGVIMGPYMAPGMDATPIGFDSHFHYLSGLLLGIGLGFWSCVPRIEHKGERFELLTAIVVTGGLARCVAWYVSGLPDTPMRFALVMELIITPLLAYWQHRVALNAERRNFN